MCGSRSIPARFGTRSLPFRDAGAGHTDLARHHSMLVRRLAGSDVVHATVFFSFGRTTLNFAPSWRDVREQDLLPAWEGAAAIARAQRHANA